MTAYFNDLKLFFQKAGAFPRPRSCCRSNRTSGATSSRRRAGDDAATVPAQVAAPACRELRGLPNTVAGFAQAMVKLRDDYAPNVMLGYHLSTWGTGDGHPGREARATARFRRWRPMRRVLMVAAAGFDVSFAEFSDRDAAFYQYQYGDPNRWYATADFAGIVLYFIDVSPRCQGRAS